MSFCFDRDGSGVSSGRAYTKRRGLSTIGFSLNPVIAPEPAPITVNDGNFESDKNKKTGKF